MTISLRLDEQLRHALEEVAHLEGVSKSDVLRRTLREFLARRTTRRLPWELGQHLFGRRGSGRSDLSRNRKRLVREKVDTRKRGGLADGTP